MPVAVKRLLVKELPADLQLDDSSSLMPSKKISTLSEVEVLARISRSGQAKAMPGDLTAAAIPAKVGNDKTVELLINSVVR
jgi:cytochrome c-type biogenesis protein CcmH